MNRSLAVTLLLAMLLVPAVGAYHLSAAPDPAEGDERDIRQRLLATHTVNLDDADAGNLMTFTFPWDPEYSYADVSHTIRVQVSYTATFPSLTSGAWTVQVAKEATGNLANCSVRVETVNPVGITLDALLVYAHYQWDCLFTISSKVHYHYHTIYVNRTAAGGTPSAMTAETLSVRLETEDVIVLPNIYEYLLSKFGLEGEPLNITTTFWPLIFAVAILGIMALREKVNYVGIGFAGVFFLYAAVAVPYGEVMGAAAVAGARIIVAAFGVYLVFISAVELRDWDSEKEVEDVSPE